MERERLTDTQTYYDIALQTYRHTIIFFVSFFQDLVDFVTNIKRVLEIERQKDGERKIDRQTDIQ